MNGFRVTKFSHWEARFRAGPTRKIGRLDMSNLDHTLPSPLSDIAQNSSALLGLTIAWHPDLDRVGEQFIGGNSAGTLEVSRFLPLFAKPQNSGLGLGHGGISRDPVRIVRGADDGLDIHLPSSKMVVEINGTQIFGAPI